MESCVFSATTFCRHFLWDKKVCHLFHETSSHLFFETSAYKRRPIFEFTNLNRTTRKETHSPCSFLQAYCRECVAVQCISKECTQSPYSCYWGPKAQYKIQTREVVCFPFLFLFGSGSVHILYSYERTEDKIQALQQFTNKSGSVFHFPVWFWFCWCALLILVAYDKIQAILTTI